MPITNAKMSDLVATLAAALVALNLVVCLEARHEKKTPHFANLEQHLLCAVCITMFAVASGSLDSAWLMVLLIDRSDSQDVPFECEFSSAILTCIIIGLTVRATKAWQARRKRRRLESETSEFRIDDDLGT